MIVKKKVESILIVNKPGVLLNGDDMRSFVTDARRDIKKPAKITKSSQPNKNDTADSFDR